MAVSKALITLVLLATVTGLSESVNGRTGSPTITSTTLSEVTVNPGEDYNITCEGDAPITWDYPGRPDSEHSIYRTEKNGKYISSIQLTNITYMQVGYYYCLLNNSSDKNSSIYLYVHDTENLFTYEEITFAPVNGLQYEDIIIPCKPTHPEVNITLCLNGIEKLHIGDNDNLGVFRYDQKVGFILENAQVINNGYYFCCVLPGGICSNNCPRTYSLDVLKHADSVAKPAIDETNLQHVKVGENVTMVCRIAVPSSIKYDLEWIIPNKSDRITVQSIVIEDSGNPEHHLSTGKRELTIVNAELKDMGNYTCKVRDHANNTNSATIYLNIFGQAVIDNAHLQHVKVGDNVTLA